MYILIFYINKTLILQTMLILIKALLKPHMQLCYIIIGSNSSIKILPLHLDVVLDVVLLL